MINKLQKLPLFTSGIALLALGAPTDSKADEFNDQVKELLQSRFAAAVILTDTDAIEFGFASFDPNDVIDTGDDNIGSAKASQNRNNKSSYILPYSLQFGMDDQHTLSSKLFYIKSKNDLSIVSDFDSTEELEEQSFGGAIGYSFDHALSEHWTIAPSLTSHLIYYKNSYANSTLEGEIVGAILDGRVLNTSAWTMLFEPGVKFDYRKPEEWGKWHFSSKWSYFNGFGWGEANDGDIGNTNGWYITNKITGYYDLFDKKHTVFAGAKRVDLSAILQSELGAQHYYAASFGWLYNNPTRWEAIKNIGLGLNFNYGSALKGGSILFHFNKF